jgi:hypothetical protein
VFRLYKQLVAAISALTFTVSSFAALHSVTVPVCGEKAHIGFTNGIQNTSEQALESLVILRMHAAAKGIEPTAAFSFYHQKGRTGQESALSSFQLDVLEVFWQQAQASVANDPAKEAQAMQLFFHVLGTAPLQSNDSWAGVLGSLLLMLAKTEDAELALNLQQATAANVRAETARDIAKLQAKLGGGDTLMMAAHSQGTLWANAALQGLAEDTPTIAKRVRLASAGMAAASVWQTPGSSTSNSYVTSTNDIVINTLRSVSIASNLVPTAQANATHSFTLGDATGHSFTAVYLDEAEDTGSKFMNYFITGFRELAKENPARLLTTDLTYAVDLTKTGWTPQHSISGYNPQGYSVTFDSVQVTPGIIREVYTYACPAFDRGVSAPVQPWVLTSLSIADSNFISAVSGMVMLGGRLFPVTTLAKVDVGQGPTLSAGNVQLNSREAGVPPTATLSLY